MLWDLQFFFTDKKKKTFPHDLYYQNKSSTEIIKTVNIHTFKWFHVVDKKSGFSENIKNIDTMTRIYDFVENMYG